MAPDATWNVFPTAIATGCPVQVPYSQRTGVLARSHSSIPTIYQGGRLTPAADLSPTPRFRSRRPAPPVSPPDNPATPPPRPPHTPRSAAARPPGPSLRVRGVLIHNDLPSPIVVLLWLLIRSAGWKSSSWTETLGKPRVSVHDDDAPGALAGGSGRASRWRLRGRMCWSADGRCACPGSCRGAGGSTGKSW